MLNEYYFEEIYIRHAIDEFPQDKDFNMHIHDTCEIYFFISGAVNYLVEGSKYKLPDNSLMIMKPAESHKAQIVKSIRYERYAINFPLSFVKSIDPQGRLLCPFTERALGKNNFFGSSDIDTQLIRRLLEEMCFENTDIYSKNLTITTHLWMILDIIYHAYTKRELPTPSPVSNAENMVQYINRHLLDELSVPMLAKHFYLSTSQFNRVFKHATGAAPWDYILQKRLTVAHEKIKQGCTAREASEQCGFREYSVFYRAYRKKYGCSPSQKSVHSKSSPFIKEK
ncbi:MAG: helix-turn-helix transcriptional regulator [Lachnospiraceae bacterium]|nr:helix-turn-helix transcriptional regulator [Lachnospiraceae bacterium]